MAAAPMARAVLADPHQSWVSLPKYLTDAPGAPSVALVAAAGQNLLSTHIPFAGLVVFLVASFPARVGRYPQVTSPASPSGLAQLVVLLHAVGI